MCLDDHPSYQKTRFIFDYIHLSSLVFLLESIFSETESDFSEGVLEKLHEPIHVEHGLIRAKFLSSLFCISLPVLATSTSNMNGNIGYISTNSGAFNVLKASVHSKMMIGLENGTSGKAYCFCGIAAAMLDFIERIRGLSLSKLDYINLILGNNWIWCWGEEKYFPNISLWQVKRDNPPCRECRVILGID